MLDYPVLEVAGLLLGGPRPRLTVEGPSGRMLVSIFFKMPLSGLVLDLSLFPFENLPMSITSRVSFEGRRGQFDLNFDLSLNFKHRTSRELILDVLPLDSVHFFCTANSFSSSLVQTPIERRIRC